MARGRKVNAAMQAEEAEFMLGCRVQGMTLRNIAFEAQVHFGKPFSHVTVDNRIKWALGQRVDASVDMLRKTEVERYDLYLSKLQPGVDSGDVQAIQTAARISKERRRLLGLDMPIKVEVSGTVEHTTPIEREMAELTDLLGLNDPTLVKPSVAGN